MLKLVMATSVAVLSWIAAGSAHSAVTVIGGGLAQACSKAAMNGEDDVKFQEVCTLALDTEFMSPRDRAGTYVNRGVLKLRRTSYSAATRDFDQAVRLRPDMGEAYVNRGAASIGQKRHADSLPDINRALELGVTEPAKAYYNRALAYEGMDDAKSAYLDYRKAVEIAPEWPAPREELTRFSVSTR